MSIKQQEKVWTSDVFWIIEACECFIKTPRIKWSQQVHLKKTKVLHLYFCSAFPFKIKVTVSIWFLFLVFFSFKTPVSHLFDWQVSQPITAALNITVCVDKCFAVIDEQHSLEQVMKWNRNIRHQLNIKSRRDTSDCSSLPRRYIIAQSEWAALLLYFCGRLIVSNVSEIFSWFCQTGSGLLLLLLWRSWCLISLCASGTRPSWTRWTSRRPAPSSGRVWKPCPSGCCPSCSPSQRPFSLKSSPCR